MQPHRNRPVATDRIRNRAKVGSVVGAGRCTHDGGLGRARARADIQGRRNRNRPARTVEDGELIEVGLRRLHIGGSGAGDNLPEVDKIVGC